MKIQSSKTIDNNVIKVYCDDDYELKSLTLEQEQALGKLELDNMLNDNKTKRSLNSISNEILSRAIHWASKNN